VSDKDATLTTLVNAIGASARPRLLFITHAWGGGVERHIADLIDITKDRVDTLVLRGISGGGVELRWHSNGVAPNVARVGGFSHANVNEWIDALRALSFARVHLHHVHGWDPAVLDLMDALDLPLDITVHDYAGICPQYHLADENGRYCGEPDENVCTSCISRRPHPWGLGITAWREMMRLMFARAERVIVPSRDVINRLERYMSALKPLHWPHHDPSPAPVDVIKVAIIGALSKTKGLDVVLDTIAKAAITAPDLAFRLIGHAAEPLPDNFTYTGSYDDSELPRLIAIERPDVLWFPSQVPETHSYTLTVAIASGLPVVATALGAHIERLQAYAGCDLISHTAAAQEWIDAMKRLGSTQRRPDYVQRALPSSPDDYADRYLSPICGGPIKPLNVSNLTTLLGAAPDAPTAVDRPIVNVFDIARRGGHRESMDFIESQIKAISMTETTIVGGSEARTLRDEVRALQHDISISAAAHLHEHREASERIERLEEAVSIHEGNIERMQADGRLAVKHIAHLEHELQRVTTSLSWRITRPARAFIRGINMLRRVIAVSARVVFNEREAGTRLLRLVRRGGLASVINRTKTELHRQSAASTASAVAAPTPPSVVHPLNLRTSDCAPMLSVIIPVYDQHLTTFACLASIAEHSPSCTFEVIVMDDAGAEIAADALSCVSGVRVIRNERNLGFIGNVNRGAEAAVGTYLLILNNDTLVTRGAIDAMVETFRVHDRVGMVGAKLLNSNGTLQEAGGIVWRDGSAWNWGRNQDAAHPQFNFVRDVDYCSGAALLIERRLFLDLGGFDSHFAPAYYEDTDLAFRIRAHGLRVLYQPHAEIFHIEGVSHGRDESSGIKAYQAKNERKFFERWQTQLLHHRENSQQPELEAHRSTKLNILVVEACMITPDQDSGSIRMLNLLKILKQLGHHVVFLADNLEGTQKYRCQLESVGVETLFGTWAGSTRRVLRERGRDLDIVMFCRHYIASAYVDVVRLMAPRAKIFFDTVDLHFLREEREANLLGNRAMLAAAAITREKELYVIRKSDVTIVVSEVEQRLLTQLVPSAKVVVVSNIHVPIGEVPGFDARDGILFVGGFRHPPNADAVIWYANEILPRVQRLLPGVMTRIVGSNVTEDIRKLNSEHLNIIGYVENIEPLLRSARVSIAPLRFGAGVKGKINEAMNYGIPVVATTSAVEGMDVTHTYDVMVADEAEDFAQAIVALHEQRGLWESISKNGQRNLNEKFSIDVAAEAVNGILA
jgi:O-antigen biosynthesis protein